MMSIRRIACGSTIRRRTRPSSSTTINNNTNMYVQNFSSSSQQQEREEEEIKRRRARERKEQQRKQYNSQYSSSSSLPYKHKKRNNDNKRRRGNKEFVSFFDLVDDKMVQLEHEKRTAAAAGRRRKEKERTQKEEQKKKERRAISILDALDRDDLFHSSSTTTKTKETSAPFLPPTQKSTSQDDEEEAPAQKSIFDMFPSSSSTTTTSIPENDSSYYNTHQYEEYKSIINQIVSSPKFASRHTKRKAKSDDFVKPIVDWLLSPKQLMEEEEEKCYKDELHVLLSSNNDTKNINEKREQLKDILKSRKEAFLSITKLSSDQYDVAQRGLMALGDFAARRAKGSDPLDVAWEKIKESGMILNEGSVNTYLYVLSTSAGSGLGGGLSSSIMGGGSGISILDIMKHLEDENSDDEDKDNKTQEKAKEEEEEEKKEVITTAEEMATFHDLLYQPTEKSVSIRVKALVAKGDAFAAEQLLNEFEANTQNADLRLRTYLPILKLYCQQRDISSALSLFQKMRQTKTVFLEPENYVLLIGSIAECGYFRSDSEPIKKAKELGYSNDSGPALFDELATEMSKEILEITSASARRLYNAFASGFKGLPMAQNLRTMHLLAAMTPENDQVANDNELVVSRVSVNGSTAQCPRTNATLRLILLEEEQRRQLHDSLLEGSKAQYEKFLGKKKADVDTAAKRLSNFARWLDSRKGKPFTAIVDGANVAYYMQNFDQGKFNFHQLEFMVDALEKMNESPLVILPNKYFRRAFYVNTGSSSQKQVLNKKELAIIDKLSKSGKLYRCPPMCLDDYYWMLASVSDQTVSRNGVDLDVPPGNEEGKWPGTRPMLITNDQMRDHRLLDLMEPRLFRRWYSCHIVNYNFTAFVDDECVDREIGFSTADFFSREIQGNPTPGNGTDTGGGMAWHFPVSDWDVDERLCIRIPSCQQEP